MAVRYGTTGPDNITGTSVNDILYGWAINGNANSLSGNDTLNGLAGNDVLNGGTGNDSLNGSTGLDTLDGGSGSDNLNGGAGNDTYIVDATTDILTENSNAGTDTVRSSVSYTLGSYLNNLTLTGTSAINGTGNSINNTITGNSANNTLNGRAGNDILNGGAGNDTLDGGAGNDGLDGGKGNDTYIVETRFDSSGNFVTDSIAEYTNSGRDTVQLLTQDLLNLERPIYYTLDSNLENLTLKGEGSIGIIGQGNALDEWH